jgi:hypothetical protein
MKVPTACRIMRIIMKLASNSMPDKMQMIYSAVVRCNIRISSFLIQEVYGFDTMSPVSMLFFLPVIVDCKEMHTENQ